MTEAIYEGWMFDGHYAFDFYPIATADDSAFLVSLDTDEDEFTVWGDAVRSLGHIDYSLHAFFINWKHPTDSERLVFEIEFGLPYVDQKLLDEMSRRVVNVSV